MTKAIATGYGLISPLGNEPGQVWDSILEGAIAAKEQSWLLAQGFTNAIACLAAINPEPDWLHRGAAFAATAAEEAVSHSGLSLHRLRGGIFIGSTIGESAAFEQAAEGAPFHQPSADMRAFHQAINQRLGINWPARYYGSACAAGNYAIGAAAHAIRRGYIDYAIAGGVDPFSRIAFSGFQRSRAMSHAGKCQPFDAERSGMVLGEGAGFVVLQAGNTVSTNKALAIVGALGLSCDAYHATAPQPQGLGMLESMQQALHLQGWNAREVDWICAHGSGTRASDAAEAEALGGLQPGLAVTGFKGALGHSLGAATAIEAVLCMVALQQQVWAPTVGHAQKQEGMNIMLTTVPKKHRINKVLNLGFAFGGLNATLCMESCS